jgi:hypothetical protein
VRRQRALYPISDEKVPFLTPWGKSHPRQNAQTIAERSFHDLSPLRLSRFHTVWKVLETVGFIDPQAVPITVQVAQLIVPTGAGKRRAARLPAHKKN